MEKTSDFRWEKNYELAKKYFEVHGNLEIPYNFKTMNGYEYDDNGVNLGRWIIIQRQAYKNRCLLKTEINNKFSTLTDEQVKLLESIGMIWAVFAENWNQMYQLTKKYYEHYGNLEIPYNFKTMNGYEYDDNGVNLGKWIQNQRTAYKNRSLSKEERKTNLVPLTDEHVELLESIGMIWAVFTENWSQMYQLTKKYYEHYGNLEIPCNFKTINGYEHDELGVNLGGWISKQRTAYKNRSLSKEERTTDRTPLTDEQVKMLESIGMIWNLRKNKIAVLELCSEYGIDIWKNKTILEHISYTELKVKILYLRDNNIPFQNDGILHEIFSMCSMNMKLKYDVSLEDLINIYMKARSI